MDIVITTYNNESVASVGTNDIIIRNSQHAIDLIGDVTYQGARKLVLSEQQLDPAFFDLTTGLAGEVLQKFVNYRIALAIIGEFSRFESKSLHDFIRESNRGRSINFVESMSEAITRLTGKGSPDN